MTVFHQIEIWLCSTELKNYCVPPNQENVEMTMFHRWLCSTKLRYDCVQPNQEKCRNDHVPPKWEMTKLKKFKPLSSNLSSTSKVNHIPTNWEMTGRHIGGTCSFLNLVEHSHFSILWNIVISTFSWFGGTRSFLHFPDLVEHSHFSILWNMIIPQFGGTQSFFNSVEHSHSQFGGTQSYLNLVEHGHFYIFLIWWNTVIFQFCGTVISQFGGTQSYLNLVEHSRLWNTVISTFSWFGGTQ